MALDRAQTNRNADASPALFALVDADGTRAHPHAAALARPGADPRDLADAVHLICSLHGRHPGLVDHSAQHRNIDGANGWLDSVAIAFADERARIVALAVAAGPLPSTPGQAESEATVTAQRHALDMLAMSARSGCSLGASLALVLDWTAIGRVLQSAGDRFGVEMPTPSFPSKTDTETLVSTLTGNPGVERAVLFGAQQLLAQHRGLFDLLQARAEAREGL
jgi:hypothetical protein